jgi:hypothetical protein
VAGEEGLASPLDFEAAIIEADKHMKAFSDEIGI